MLINPLLTSMVHIVMHLLLADLLHVLINPLPTILVIHLTIYTHGSDVNQSNIIIFGSCINQHTINNSGSYANTRDDPKVLIVTL